jgi:hypothetical protein
MVAAMATVKATLEVFEKTMMHITRKPPEGAMIISLWMGTAWIATWLALRLLMFLTSAILDRFDPAKKHRWHRLKSLMTSFKPRKENGHFAAPRASCGTLPTIEKASKFQKFRNFNFWTNAPLINGFWVRSKETAQRAYLSSKLWFTTLANHAIWQKGALAPIAMVSAPLYCFWLIIKRSPIIPTSR